MTTPVLIDPARRYVSAGEHGAVLHERSWQVLQLVLERAPAVVSRDEFIEQLWHGNAPVGEKGLNQAIWSIRAALGDDPRQPRFIRTIPRRGYQWVGPESQPIRATQWQKLAAGMAAVALLTVAVPASRWVLDDGAQAAPGDVELVATSARLVDGDVHVQFRQGCLGIFKNATNASLGAPVLSRDGSEVAVPVFEESSCRLVTIDLNTRQKQNFAECPVDRI